MTTITDIESLGIELPKGRALGRILDNTSDDYARLTCHNWLIEKDKRYRSALAEAYAVIERLVGERDAVCSPSSCFCGGRTGHATVQYDADETNCPVCEALIAKHTAEAENERLTININADIMYKSRAEKATRAVAELERKVQMIVDWHASDKKHIAELEAELTEFRAAVSGHDLKSVNTRLVNDNLGLRDEIEQAEAKVEELDAELGAPWHIGAFIDVDGITVGPHMVREWRERIQKLEDEVDRRTREVELCAGVQKRLREQLEATIESLLDEVERLRCCGNCTHYSFAENWCVTSDRGCCLPQETTLYGVEVTDPCQWSPSRWTDREES